MLSKTRQHEFQTLGLSIRNGTETGGSLSFSLDKDREIGSCKSSPSPSEKPKRAVARAKSAVAISVCCACVCVRVLGALCGWTWQSDEVCVGSSSLSVSLCGGEQRANISISTPPLMTNNRAVTIILVVVLVDVCVCVSVFNSCQ